MTRNDFELLARALKSARNDLKSLDDLEEMGFDIAVNAVMTVCAANNARFDKKRFAEATQ